MTFASTDSNLAKTPSHTVWSGNDIFVGRESEMATLQAGLGDALAGHGRLFLLAGEPGIGKTRTAHELANYAQLHNARVLTGRCYEGDGAPPFWPWVQIVRSYISDCNPAALRVQMGTGAADIAQVIPEIHEHLGGVSSPPLLDPEHARFRFFDSLTTFLKTAAKGQAQVLFLDDLHWADKPSLLLLQFLAGELHDARMLVIGTYRDMEGKHQQALSHTLGELARVPESQRILLSGLEVGDVANFVERATNISPPETLVTALYQQTEGNPFFLTEIVRLLATRGEASAIHTVTAAATLPIPQQVHEVIVRRLDQLSEDCQRVLTIAAVLGREFSFPVLRRASNLSGDSVLESLEEAVTARIITKTPDRRGHYSFSHTLIREALYRQTSLTQRVRLHRCVGEVLENLLDSHSAPSTSSRLLAELAYHFCAAAQGGDDVDKAIEYSERAGEQAVTLFAYEKAVSHYETALQLLALKEVDEVRRCELLLAFGDALWRAGATQQARDTFESAARVAQTLNMEELLARAALGFGTVRAETGLVDETLVQLLEAALAALPHDPSALRVKLLARLAVALYFSPAAEYRQTLSEQALTMARQIQDPHALAFALIARHFTGWGVSRLTDRLALATEAVRVAEESGDQGIAFEGQAWKILDLFELGDIEAMDREIESYAQQGAKMCLPRQQWHLRLVQAARALLAGRFEEGEQLANEAITIRGESSEMANAMPFYGIQMFAVRREQDRLAELEPAIATLAAQFPTLRGWRCSLAILHCDLGNLEAARQDFEHLAAQNFVDVPRDGNWLPVIARLADVCSVLGDTQRAAMLYDVLLPYAEQNIVLATSAACLGPASYYLGLLATILSRWDDAEAHFEAALKFNTKMGARPFVTHTQYQYARMLLARGTPSDWEKAWELLTRGLNTAQELGMEALVKQALALKVKTRNSAVTGQGGNGIRSSGSAASAENQSLSEASIFHREGDYWTIAHQGTVFRLKDIRGLSYINHLLRHPNREFCVLDLLALSRKDISPRSSASEITLVETDRYTSELGDAGEILDPQARVAYKQRLEELREELEEARRFNDLARADQAQHEINCLTQQLASAVGLGGRNRRAASHLERARINVAKGIKAALAKIAQHSPTLELYLATTIKTGLFCSFTPTPRTPVDWQF
ncbi:MAG: AAA family ATPase [Candidatus Binatia bacterium]